MNGMVEEVKGSKMDQKETHYVWLFSSGKSTFNKQRYPVAMQ